MSSLIGSAGRSQLLPSSQNKIPFILPPCPHRSSSAHLTPLTHRSNLLITAAKKSSMSEADLYVAIDPNTAPAPTPLYIKLPTGFISLIIVLRTLKFIKKKLTTRTSDLEERGFIRGGVADDVTYSKMMKGMKTVQYEELSDEEILAARMRRRREVARDMAPMDLDEIELPENHPFAVKKNLTKKEEEEMKARLGARRGLSAEDMAELRRQQELARKMDEE